MLRNTLIKLLVFCVLLVGIRILRTGHFSFLFLFWNLFLAWVPVWIIGNYKPTQSVAKRSLLLFGTLLFLPNAPYILTDLFHLTKNLAAPMWYDLILISCFSIFGLVLFFIATERLFVIIKPLFTREWLFNVSKLMVFLLNGYGIYAGRYLRLNSWDVLYHPHILAKRMFSSVFDPSDYKETLAITITFSIFLYLVFGIYEMLSLKALQQHKRHEIS